MQPSYLLLPFQILLLVFFEKAYGLKCYECNSHIQQACAGDVAKFKDQFLIDCPQNATSCRKIQQQVYYSDDYHDRTIRQCSFVMDPPTSCIDRTGTYRFKTSYCHCLDEGCNSGHTIVVSFILLALTHILTKAL